MAAAGLSSAASRHEPRCSASPSALAQLRLSRRRAPRRSPRRVPAAAVLFMADRRAGSDAAAAFGAATRAAQSQPPARRWVAAADGAVGALPSGRPRSSALARALVRGVGSGAAWRTLVIGGAACGRRFHFDRDCRASRPTSAPPPARAVTYLADGGAPIARARAAVAAARAALAAVRARAVACWPADGRWRRCLRWPLTRRIAEQLAALRAAAAAAAASPPPPAARSIRRGARAAVQGRRAALAATRAPADAAPPVEQGRCQRSGAAAPRRRPRRRAPAAARRRRRRASLPALPSGRCACGGRRAACAARRRRRAARDKALEQCVRIDVERRRKGRRTSATRGLSRVAPRRGGRRDARRRASPRALSLTGGRRAGKTTLMSQVVMLALERAAASTSLGPRAAATRAGCSTSAGGFRGVELGRRPCPPRAHRAALPLPPAGNGGAARGPPARRPRRGRREARAQIEARGGGAPRRSSHVLLCTSRPRASTRRDLRRFRRLQLAPLTRRAAGGGGPRRLGATHEAAELLAYVEAEPRWRATTTAACTSRPTRCALSMVASDC